MIGSVTQYQQEMLAAEKARRKRDRDLVPQDGETAEQPLTEAPEMARAAVEDVATADVGKDFRARGITEGPGDYMAPGKAPDAGTYRRPYLDADHAAPSPMQEAPNRNPVAGSPPGELVHINLPGTTVAGHPPAHVTSALSMGSPSDR